MLVVEKSDCVTVIVVWLTCDEHIVINKFAVDDWRNGESYFSS